MADRTPPWPDRTVGVPPGPVDPWPNAGHPWPDSGHSWPDSGDSWPDAGAWPGTSGPGSGAKPGSGGPGQGGSGQGGPGQGGNRPAFNQGRAQVGAQGPATRSYPAHDETYGGTPGWRGSDAAPRPPLRHQIRQLRKGGEWTTVGGLFGFICWGIWAISMRGNLTVPVLAFVLVLLIAGGVFALSRLLGMLILERGFGRTRNSARISHMITGLFLAGAGVAYLKQTEWVVAAWNWVRDFLN